MTDYQKEYYEEHKEELNERKKEKYENDPEYREKVKASAKVRYWEKRMSEIGEPHIVPFDEVKIEVEPDGELEVEGHGKVNFYRVSKLRVVMGRSGQTIRLWHSRGVIPEDVNYHPNHLGHRRYTEDQVKVFKSVKPLLDFAASNIEESLFAKMLQKLLRAQDNGVQV